MGVHHIPERDKEGRQVVYLSPFANKRLPEGDLFKRVHGVSATIAAGSTGNVELVVPYNIAKFNGAEIINCKLGDTVDFMVYDNPSGTISGVPDLMLNQFGFNVQMPNDFYKNTSEYDADIILGMKIQCQYTNNGADPVTIYMNVELHENEKMIVMAHHNNQRSVLESQHAWRKKKQEKRVKIE